MEPNFISKDAMLGTFGTLTSDLVALIQVSSLLLFKPPVQGRSCQLAGAGMEIPLNTLSAVLKDIFSSEYKIFNIIG